MGKSQETSSRKHSPYQRQTYTAEDFYDHVEEVPSCKKELQDSEQLSHILYCLYN